MSTIDMTGSKTKEKKLLLTISKEDFLEKLLFHSEEEKNKCKIYLNLKGVSYHVVLANYIGINRKGKIEYKKVSNLYIYDKRIRNVLYKFLSALEEGIRAFISNEYSNNIQKFKRFSRRIYTEIQKGSSLSKELENLDFNKLLNLSKKLNKKHRLDLFGSIENLDSNLDAVRELRNTVSHHRMLFVYEDFEACYIDGIESESLIYNIKNLYLLLNSYYKEFFRTAINDSSSDRRDSQFKNSLPEKSIISI